MERINNRYTRDMKQTAVEWLIEQLENHNGVTRSGFEKCIQQAKEMEKEQMNNAYNDDRPSLTIYESNEAFEQYYNETYKSE